MWTVYKHTTPSGKVYIGITQQLPKNRWLCGHGYKTNKHFYNAIKKYGWNSISHDVIAEFPTQADAEELERALIFEYKSYDKNFGYNKALGGHALSKDSRKKIGDTRRERGITSWTLGKHLSEETKAKISKARTGKHYSLSEEAKRNIAESKRGTRNPNFGKPMSDKCRAALRKATIRSCERCVDGIIEKYSSIQEASAATGVCASNIQRCCAGKRLRAGGYEWRYSET